MAIRAEDEPRAATAPTAGNEEGETFGQQFEGLRLYLLMVAGQAMSPAIRAKCGMSDLVQETLCEAIRDRDSLRARTGQEVRGWLRGILLNNIRDAARALGLAKRDVRLEVPIGRGEIHGLVDPEPTPGTRAVAFEEAEAVDAGLARLPEHYRRVIELRSRDALAFDAIGEILGRSADAARMLWFRAIERLQHELAEPDGT